MKRLLWIFVLIVPLSLLQASDWNLVRVPVPKDAGTLSDAGFQLFHRAGDYWIGGIPKDSPLPSGGSIFTGYRHDGGELFRLLLASPGEADKLAGKVNLLFSAADEVIFQANADQLSGLPEIRGEWIRISLTPKPMKYSGVEIPATDDFHPIIPELINQVSQIQYTDYLQTLEDFVTRNTYTTGCDNAADWILAQFQSFGLDARFDNFTIGSYTKHNVVGEIPGFLYPDSVLFITSHYDATAGSPGSPEPVAPGADDNGSGTACVLECARILSQYNFEKTIRFVAFAGEEQGLYGSNDYVDDLLAAGTIVVGSFNYDMIAYSGNDPLPPDLVLYTDNNPRSQAMAYKVEEAILTFLPTELEPDVDISPSMGSSDHGPFWDAGLPAICGIEEQAWGPDFNPFYHSVNDLVVNCDLEYATNVTKVALAAFADYAGPIVESGPYIAINDKEFDEITGNGNGAPDPGETMSLLVTLINVGNEAATGISATLTTSDPYLTITQNYATYPNLDPMATGVASQAHEFAISSSCPQGTWVSTDLEITADGGYQNSSVINFMVGDPVYEPTGPDAYGYLAYDPFDEPEYPVYEWVEICADSGGSGTLVNFTLDDQTLQFDLPFTFQYYGQSFTRYTIAANGWIGMGDILEDDYSNSAIPNSDGPAGMIAPYWEDLSPQRQNSGRVWQWYDSANNRLIVEYNHVEQYAPTGSFETFQVILLDPAYYQTSTGDGKIIIQYKDMSGIAQGEGTIGIEDPSETMGLQYLFDGAYDIHAAHITDEMAILITPPENMPGMTISLTYNSGSPVPPGGGYLGLDLYLENLDPNPVNFDLWIAIEYEGGAPTTLAQRNLTFPAGHIIYRPDMNWPIPAGWAAGDYMFWGRVGVEPNQIWDESGFPFSKDGTTAVGGFTPWMPVGAPNPLDDIFGDIERGAAAAPAEFALLGVYPNPFNPSTAISYQLSALSRVNLSVYDIAGRMVAELVNGWKNPGRHEATLNAAGLASGVYIYRLEAGEFRVSGKMVLMK